MSKLGAGRPSAAIGPVKENVKLSTKLSGLHHFRRVTS